MPPEVEYKASAERDLRKIDKKQINRLLDKIEEVLGEDPGKGEALKGRYKGLFKLRVGEYRVIYAKTKKGVLIIRIAPRGKAY
ncbi:MAG: type II toxin-antitoxin system RelE/ParE family toxin [Thermoplasmata archaeon]|nr:type II toxin-antitoxin system RelE/ParE family toxin [Thermoplasmata archaeon]